MKEFTDDLDKNINMLSVDDWKNVLSSSLAFKYTTKPYDINPKILYRARPNFDSERKPIDFFTHTKELWAPPAKCVGKDGRCNVKGQSTLYCATSVTTTLFEVRPDTGEELTFMDYDVTGDITSLGIVGCKEITLLGDDYNDIFGGHFNDSSNDAETLDDVLSKVFKTRHSKEYPIYNLTNAVFQTFTDAPKKDIVPDFLKPPKFNGVIYPSLATDKLLGINIAMDPDAVKHLLKPFSAYKYKVLKKIDDHHYEIILTHRTSNIAENGELTWTENENAVVEKITDTPQK